jgi:hypothetical protein
MCLRDEMGNFIFSACRFLESCNVEGLVLSLQHNQLPVIIDSYFTLLLLTIKGTPQERSPYLHYIYEI